MKKTFPTPSRPCEKNMRQSNPFFILWIASQALAMTLAFASLPAHAQDGGKESAYDRVMRTGVIRCGYAMSPPNLKQDPNTGELSGLERDIWLEISKELDVKIEWVEEVGWGNYIEGLKTERYDVFCNQAWPTPARIKNSILIGPTTYQLVYGYARIDDARFDNGELEKINSPEIRIPAIDGDITEIMVKNKFPDAKLDLLPQIGIVNDMFLSVTTKKSDILFLDQSFFEDFEKANPGKLKRIPTKPIFVYAGHYSVNNGEYKLAQMIEISLRRIIDDGRMKNMAHRYSKAYYIPNQNYETPAQ